MQSNVRFVSKGVGGLHDTFRIVKRSKPDIYTQPIPSAVDIISVDPPVIKNQTMGKRRSSGSVTHPYKKRVKRSKQAVTSLKRRSNKVIKRKNIKPRRVKDRF